MVTSPLPFSEIGKRARDLLTKDYNYDQKFTLSMQTSDGMGLSSTGVKRDQHFVGDISTQYKSGKTTVDVKIDTTSSVSTTVTMDEIVRNTKATLSFKLPDNQSSKLDLQHRHPHAAISTSIGLSQSPVLEVAATIGSKDLSLGGEVGFDVGSAFFTKYNIGIGFSKPDYSAAVVLADKGETLKVSYVHSLSPSSGATVGAEMIRNLATYEKSYAIGSSHCIDPVTVVKTRYSDNGKFAVLCQREWRPKSLVTFSSEYDTKAISSAPKLGLALSLKP